MTSHSETCQRCAGNGEIVTDWERYMNPLPGDVGDEAVEPCPDCDGTGTTGGPTEENTPEGIQLVIPGAEKRLPTTAKQMELW